jgi:DNA invertase Pin-like site-specific DNA recombinase
MGCAAAGARAIGDVRVSTESGLGLEEQRTSIEQAVERLGVPLFSVHVDAGFSGSLSLDQRPGLAGPQRSPPR